MIIILNIWNFCAKIGLTKNGRKKDLQRYKWGCERHLYRLPNLILGKTSAASHTYYNTLPRCSGTFSLNCKKRGITCLFVQEWRTKICIVLLKRIHY